MTSFYIN